MTQDDLIASLRKVESLLAQLPDLDRGLSVKTGLPALIRAQRHELATLTQEIEKARAERDKLKAELVEMRQHHDQIHASEKVIKDRLDQVRASVDRAMAAGAIGG
jgi:uncharacterized coiled-coil DUF342 family protein